MRGQTIGIARISQTAETVEHFGGAHEPHEVIIVAQNAEIIALAHAHIHRGEVAINRFAGRVILATDGIDFLGDAGFFINRQQVRLYGFKRRHMHDDEHRH